MFHWDICPAEVDTMSDAKHSEVRGLKINADRKNLTSHVTTILRSWRIPMSLIGGDLIRGAVFDRLDHPDHSYAAAIGRAFFYSNLPGTMAKTMEDCDADLGYDLIYEAIEASPIKGVPWIPSTHPDRVTKVREIVDKVLDNIEYDVYKAVCHSAVYRHFEANNYGFDSELATNLVKDMVYKKLVAYESSEECTLVYAYKKEFQKDEVSFEDAKERIHSYLRDYCNEVERTPYQVACDIADKIINENLPEADE